MPITIPTFDSLVWSRQVIDTCLPMRIDSSEAKLLGMTLVVVADDNVNSSLWRGFAGVYGNQAVDYKSQEVLCADLDTAKRVAYNMAVATLSAWRAVLED